MRHAFSSDDYFPSFAATGDMSVISKGKTAPLYVYRSVVNTKDIVAWAKSQGFESIVTPAELHVTVIYSKVAVDWFSFGDNWSGDAKGNVTVLPGGPRAVEKLGNQGAVVLMFASSDLAWRNRNAVEDHGASWDFESYQPHITISYNAGDLDLTKVEPYTGKIILGPEMFEDIEDNYTAEETVTLGVTVEKSIPDQRLVFGWAYVCEANGETVTDWSGDQWNEADMEKSFYDYAEKIGVAGRMHEEIGVGQLVECMVFTKEKQAILGIDLGKVGVWTGFRVNQETFDKVKNQELRMLSIGGSTKKVPIDA